jgi:hypothetical protein
MVAVAAGAHADALAGTTSATSSTTPPSMLVFGPLTRSGVPDIKGAKHVG